MQAWTVRSSLKQGITTERRTGGEVVGKWFFLIFIFSRRSRLDICYFVNVVHAFWKKPFGSVFKEAIEQFAFLVAQIIKNEILKKIRKDNDLQTIKIIAVVDSPTKPEQDALLQKGYDEYISKKWPIEEVIKKIEQAIAIIY